MTFDDWAGQVAERSALLTITSRRTFLKSMGMLAGSLMIGAVSTVMPEAKTALANGIQYCYTACNWACNCTSAQPFTCIVCSVCGCYHVYVGFYAYCEWVYGARYTCETGYTGPWYRCQPGCGDAGCDACTYCYSNCN